MSPIRTDLVVVKKHLLGSITFLPLFAGTAMAADIPVKPAVYKAPPPVAVFTWTGFYVGGNVGYSWGSSSNDWNFFAQNVLGNGACSPAFAGSLCTFGSDANKLSGAIGGAQAGYNWQIGPYVTGVEADFQASGQKGSQLFSPSYLVELGNPNP